MSYRRPYRGTQPDYLFPPYASTVKRAPSQPLVVLPHTLSELTAPVFGYSDINPDDHDLTRQHKGEPIGERIIVSGRVLDENGKPIVIANLGGYFDPLVQQFENAIRSGYARPEHRILYALADNTQAILTFLEGAPVLERKPGDWA